MTVHESLADVMESLFPEVPLAPRPLLPSEPDIPPSLTARTLDGLEWLQNHSQVVPRQYVASANN